MLTFKLNLVVEFGIIHKVLDLDTILATWVDEAAESNDCDDWSKLSDTLQRIGIG